MIVTFTPVNIGGPDPTLFDIGGGTSRTLGAIVGGEDALAVADEDAAYVEVGGTEVATFTVVPDKPTPPVDQLIQVWWAAQFRLLDPPSFPTAPDYIVAIKADEFGVANFDTENPPTHSTDWVIVESSRYPLGYGEVGEEMYQVMAFDPAMVAALEASQRVQISWLRFYAEFRGEIPLRIRQRGDGLGMGGPRVRGVGSRQRSPRVRGYV